MADWSSRLPRRCGLRTDARALCGCARARAARRADPRTVLVSTGATELGGIGIQVAFELLHQDETVEVVRVVGPDTPTGPMVRRPRERLLVSPPDPRGCVSDGDCICRYRWDDRAAGSVRRHSRGRHGRSRESESAGGGSRSQRMRGFCRRGRARNDVPDTPGRRPASHGDVGKWTEARRWMRCREGGGRRSTTW